ncbi:hypothetical protein [Streptomyces sp. NPDC059176]|uniref:hypothetical protein n=1 Tax=unclassified Streptomyces TaxID=2593676 RepID=UPI0036CDDB19
MNATSAGVLLLCRAAPADVRLSAPLLREPLHLAPAGDGWTVLVPEARTRTGAGEPVDRMAAGWAAALAVGANWPVLALWWDADRAGYSLASGFRRTVDYVWLADGTPAGEDEAMSTFASRLDLDPVLDVQDLERLTRPASDADAHARLKAVIAVLARTGLALPAGLTPGEPTERLGSAVRHLTGAELFAGPGLRDAVRAEAHALRQAPGPRAPAVAQIAAGLPMTVWGLARRSAGWTAAGVVLLVHGVLGMARARS